MKLPRLVLFIVIPLLLLVPLAVTKWHADHPPLSKSDRVFRLGLSQAPWVRLRGRGTRWRQLTQVAPATGLQVTDQALINELAETLRCTDRALPHQQIPLDNFIQLYFPVTAPPRRSQTRVFCYFHDAQGAYVQHLDFDKENFDGESMVEVEPHFAERFEALIARLAQEARAKGHHPQVTFEHISAR